MDAWRPASKSWTGRPSDSRSAFRPTTSTTRSSTPRPISRRRSRSPASGPARCRRRCSYQRLGKERIYSEAVDSHISGWFWNAAAQARIRPIAQPQYDFELPTEDDQDWQFQATVPVQPKVEVVDWVGLEVPRPDADVPAELVDQELEALRESVAELVPADDRPVQAGDTVVVDLVSPNGDAQRDTVVEVGAGRLIEEIETALTRRVGGRDAAGDLRARRRVVGVGRDHGQGDQGEGAARARRRPRALGERVRHPGRAARRHRGTPARAARRRDRQRLPCERRGHTRARVEGEPGRPARRVAHARAADGLRALARAPRDLGGELPPADGPHAAGADRVDGGGSGAVGRPRARARGRRRPARRSRCRTSR